jgi:hypothetical protein
VRGKGLVVKAHNVYLSHLRFRIGDVSNSGDNVDAVCVSSSSGEEPPEVYNVVMDHCSMSWASDENVCTWWPNVHDVTLRYSIVSEALYDSTVTPSDYPWNMGSGFLVGDHSKRVASIANLFAHNNKRQPVFKGDTSGVAINNVIYDPHWEAIHMYDTEDSGPVQLGIYGNKVIQGASLYPDFPGDDKWPFRSDGRMAAVHLKLNSASSDSPESKVEVDDTAIEGERIDPLVVVRFQDEPVDHDPIVPKGTLDWGQSFTIRPSSEVESFVIKHAGARPLDRDPVDERIIDQLMNRTGTVIRSQDDVGGWPALAESQRDLSHLTIDNILEQRQLYRRLVEPPVGDSPAIPTPPANLQVR